MKGHLKTAWTHIRRSPYKAFSAVGVMTLTFSIASVIFLTAAGFQVVLNYFETRPQVTAFLKDSTTKEQTDMLQAKLIETGKVKEMNFISKEKALEIYQEQNKDDPLLLEMVTASILPASLEVSTTDISYLGEIAKILKDEPAVEEVAFQEDVVKSLNDWTNALRQVGIGLVGFLVVVSFFIVLVIVGIKVALHRKEIEILQLMGASSWYIRSPFIFEGIFYGIAGAIAGWGIAWLGLLYATPFLVKFLAGIPIFPVPILFMLSLLGGELLVGTLIGILGSIFAVKRYLR